MSPQPHDGPAEEGPACSTLCPGEDKERTVNARDMLSRFNHRCRNSLNGIKMSLYLFRHEVGGQRPGSLGEVLERAYQQVEVVFDRLQMIYRPLTLTLVRAPLGRFFDERLPSWRSRLSRRGRTLDLAPPVEDLPGDFDPMIMALGFDAFVAWRAEAGQPHTKTVLSWRIADGFFEFTWQERRLPNGSPTHDYDNEIGHRTGLTCRVDSLAHLLLKRIVLAHCGHLETTCDPNFVTTIRWPRLQQA